MKTKSPLLQVLLPDGAFILLSSGLVERKTEYRHRHMHGQAESESKKVENIQALQNLVVKVEGNWMDRAQGWCVLLLTLDRGNLCHDFDRFYVLTYMASQRDTD